ncbi:MAG: hypothetical protein RMM30_02225 [Armatimonadota bacterium]|nr:hypothetical protein [Armatimonadota bacterium]MDW8155389.1 hypothetical protein [Armatimonadota bacterium]
MTEQLRCPTTLRALSHALRAEFDGALAGLLPLVEDLERARRRIELPARVCSGLGTALVVGVLGALVLLVAGLLVGVVSPPWADQLLTAGGLLLLGALPVTAVWLGLDAALRRQPFFLRYRREFLPRLAYALGLDYREAAEGKTPQGLGPTEELVAVVRERFGANHLEWTVVLIPRTEHPAVVLAGLRASYRVRRGRTTVFKGVVAVTRAHEAGPAPRRPESPPAPEVVVVRGDGRVYAFVRCGVDLLDPDATVPCSAGAVDGARRWFGAAAEAVAALADIGR